MFKKFSCSGYLVISIENSWFVTHKDAIDEFIIVFKLMLANVKNMLFLLTSIILVGSWFVIVFFLVKKKEVIPKNVLSTFLLINENVCLVLG